MTQQAVPLGIVTRVHVVLRKDRAPRLQEGQIDYADADDFLAVRLLGNGEAGRDIELVQGARCIHIGLLTNPYAREFLV